MLKSGQTLTLQIDKPAAGGRMIARADGEVVLVSGAIPGERVTARIERVGKGVAFAETVSVEEPSVDRRSPDMDPACGGCLYAHVSYPRQRALKADVIGDALARIGRIVWPHPITVAASPETGYRMRARLHVRHGRVGFFREGSHDICDARQTGQLLLSTFDAIDSLRTASVFGDHDAEIEVSENQDASQRAIHIERSGDLDVRSLARAAEGAGVTGLTMDGATPMAAPILVAGDPYVTDTLTVNGRPVVLRRHVLSFFQGNRYLLGDLVERVAANVTAGDRVLDLYAGAGLFSLTAAACGARVTAVEGDAVAAADLRANAREWDGAVEAVHQPVEEFASRHRSAPTLLIVDPPRTGMSKASLIGAIALSAPRLLYVSCDVATLARDARQIIDAGYEIERIDAFDLFPGTPHVETVVGFRRGRALSPAP